MEVNPLRVSRYRAQVVLLWTMWPQPKVVSSSEHMYTAEWFRNGLVEGVGDWGGTGALSYNIRRY